MTARLVAWVRSGDDIHATEECSLSVRAGGLSLVGTVIGADRGLPFRVEYRVLAGPDGLTTAVHVRDFRGFGVRTLQLQRNAKGAWSLNGTPAPNLAGCSDVDLGCSPSTNTLPIRRLRRAVDPTLTIAAAWVLFPDLTAQRATQAYRRVDDVTYHYASGTFESDLTVDDEGLVTEYAEWHRIGVAMGPDDTPPLDVPARS